MNHPTNQHDHRYIESTSIPKEHPTNTQYYTDEINQEVTKTRETTLSTTYAQNHQHYYLQINQYTEIYQTTP